MKVWILTAFSQTTDGRFADQSKHPLLHHPCIFTWPNSRGNLLLYSVLPVSPPIPRSLVPRHPPQCPTKHSTTNFVPSMQRRPKHDPAPLLGRSRSVLLCSVLLCSAFMPLLSLSPLLLPCPQRLSHRSVSNTYHSRTASVNGHQGPYSTARSIRHERDERPQTNPHTASRTVSRK